VVLSEIYQKELSEAIRLAISGDSLEVGKSVVYYVKHVLTQEDVKKELKLDFDEIEIHPAQHSAYTADVVLLKKGKLVRMINAKTCVSGNLESTLNALRKSKRKNEDGLIIFGLACTKPDNSVRRILGMIFIDKKFLFSEPTENIMDTIISKLKKKQKDEGCKELTTYSLNQMIAMESLVNALKAFETAEKANKNAEMANKNAKLANKNAEKASKNAEMANKNAEAANKNAELANKNAELASKNAEAAKRIAEETKISVKRLEEKLDKLLDIVIKLTDTVNELKRKVEKSK